MGEFPFFILVQIQTRISEYRILVSFQAPKVVHDFVCDAESCTSGWHKAWWLCFAKHVLHPNRGKAPSQAILELDGLTIPGMRTGCRVASVQAAKEFLTPGATYEELITSLGLGYLESWVMRQDVAVEIPEAFEDGDDDGDDSM
jgi:hypothetical protein